MDNSNIGLPVSIKQKNLDIIKDNAAKAEKEGKPGKPQLSAAHEQKWFTMLAPATLGGGQMTLPDMLEVTEAVSRADGSMGWAVANGACAGWYAGFQAAAPGGKMLYTGSQDVTGTAEKKGTGYVINGYWQHLPLAADATGYVLRCVVKENGQPVKDANNTTEVITVVLGNDEVSVQPMWNGMGLGSTAAHDVEVKKLTVKADRVIKADSKPVVDAPLYHYPQLQINEAATAIAVCGMTEHFTDLCRLMLTEKKNPYGTTLAENAIVMDMFEKGVQRVADARSKMYYAVQMTWQACANGLSIKPAVLYKVSVGAYDLVRKCREHVDAIYPFLGLAAADKATEINRVWRDIHTASMHGVLVFGNLPG